MSQPQFPTPQFPPPPYVPPTVHPSAWAYAQPHAAGRAAALWQLILGGLIFLCGTCVGTILLAAPAEMLEQAAKQQQQYLPPMGGYSPAQEFRIIGGVCSVAMLVAGGLLLILAIFVRKGGKASIVASIVLTGLVGLLTVTNLAGNLSVALVNPTVLAPMAIFLGVLALCIVTIVKLVQAYKTSGLSEAMAMQQAYWMMMQQQGGANFGQNGYGYGPPPPNPPAPPTG